MTDCQPGAMIAGKYRLIRPLSNSTWLAQSDEEKLVLKLFPYHLELWLRVTQEGERLKRIESPRIAPLLDQGVDGPCIYRAFGFLEGLTLEHRLRSGPLQTEEFFRYGQQLLENLTELHDQQLLHRDLKPSNLVITSQGLSLIDFTFSPTDGDRLVIPMGTVLYSAPETAGLLQRDIGPPSDLYSAGAVLFECLAGQPPYSGNAAGEILRKHLNAPIPTLSGYPHLQPLWDGLLAKEPGDRYASAAEVCRLLRELQNSGYAPPPPAKSSQANPRPVGLSESLAAGLQKLNEAGCLLVSAESGGGKTVFLEELASRWEGRAFRGQGTTQSGQYPWQTLISPLFRLLGQCSGAELEMVHQRLGLWSSQLTAAIPQLGQFFSGESSPGIESQGRSRTLLALLSLLESVASLDDPTLLLLDDVQWADPSCLDLLQAWQRGSSWGNLYLVVSTRTGARPQELEKWPELCLPPLSSAESRELIHQLAPMLPPHSQGLLLEQCRGNPFLLVSALRGLSAPLPSLFGEQINWLRRAAILGRQFRLAALSLVVGISVDELLQGLETARALGVVLADREGLTWSFAHDRFREQLLELPEAERRHLHEVTATALADSQLGDDFELAYHFHQAGLANRARVYALQAARAARATSQFRLAADYYSIALSAVGDFQTRLDRGLALYYGERAPQAEAAFEELLQETQDPLAQARILYWLGDLAFSQGQFAKVQTYVSRALESLGSPCNLRPSPLRMAATYLSRALRFQPPKSLSKQPTDSRAILLVECLNLLGHATLHNGQPPLGTYLVLQALNLAETRVGGATMGFEWVHHSTTLAHLGPLRAGSAAYCKLGLQLLRTEGSDELQWCKAQARSIVHRLHHEKASQLIPLIREFMPRLQRTGHVFETYFYQYITGYLLLAAGEIPAVARLARDGYELMLRLGNPRCRIMMLNLWARSSPQTLPEEFLERELGGLESLDLMARLQLKMALAISRLRRGRPKEAYEMLTKVVHSAPSENISFRLIQAECLRRWAEKLPPRARRRRQLFWQGLKLAKSALRLAQFAFPVLSASAQREVGLQQLALEQSKAGLRSLETSLRFSENLEHRYDAAVAHLELARWRMDQAQGEATEELLWSLQKLEEMGVHWHHPQTNHPTAPSFPPARIDRFENLLHWGQTLASQLQEELIWKNLWQALTQLLRCEECQVLRPDRSPEWGPPQPTSRSLLEAATRSGRCCVADEASLDQSIAFRSARSALACPVMVEGELVRLVHVTHPLVARLFEPEEQQLTEFLCSLAAAACQNARRHQALQRTEAQLRAIFQAAGVGLALLNGRGIVLESNPALRAFLEQSELQGQTLEPFFEQPLPLEEQEGSELHVVAGGRRRLLCRYSLSAVGEDWLLTLIDASSAQLAELSRFQKEERRWMATLQRRRVVLRTRRLEKKVAVLGNATSSRLAGKLCDTTRSLFYSLRSCGPESFDLGQRLDHYLDWFEQTTRIRLERRIPSLPALDELQSNGVFRLIQEALNNVARHSQAGLVEVRLTCDDVRLQGEVRDDGRGFEPISGHGRQGLQGMAFRCQLLGGEIELESQPGSGTRVKFQLPLKRSRKADLEPQVRGARPTE